LRAVLLALMASLCLAAFAPALASAATGSIAGTVTDASSGEPVEGAEVCAGPFDSEEGVEACAHTETDGTYFIGGLDPASYRVWFWGGSQYVFEYFDGKRSWEDADPVEVPSGGKADGVDADLDRTAAINGTVRASEDGLGVEAIDVCAYPIDLAEENFGRCAETAGDGTYSIGGLSPGDYKVEFWPGFSGRKLAYQFWDHESRYPQADVLTLTEGEWLEGIDAELEPGATITGTVINFAKGVPMDGVRVCTIDAPSDTLTVCTWTNEAGGYRINTLPSGSFKVVFSPEMWEFFPESAATGEEDDGFPTRFWDNQTTIAAANVISLGTGSTAEGIDAGFGTPAVTPILSLPNPQAPIRKKHKCRRGFKKKLVKGKRRCVKVRRQRRHRHRHHSGTTAQRFFAR
jgi:hypothetical protein